LPCRWLFEPPDDPAPDDPADDDPADDDPADDDPADDDPADDDEPPPVSGVVGIGGRFSRSAGMSGGGTGG
jgi:hypothetical protein